MNKFYLIFLALLISQFSFSQSLNIEYLPDNFSPVQNSQIIKVDIQKASINTNKMDPLLKYIANHSRIFSKKIQSTNLPTISSLAPLKVDANNQVMLPLLIKSNSVNTTSNLVSSVGGTVYSIAGNILVTEYPLLLLDKLISASSTLYAEINTKRDCYLNESIADVKADEVHSGLNLTKSYKGKGTIVGVVDSGIDWKHEDFKNNEGSRIKYLWDMSGTGNPPSEFNYGTLFTKAQLDALQCSEKDLDDGHGHGTHVTGIAAGAGEKNTNFVGMSPESEIIFVKGFKSGPGFLDGDVINGCNYVFTKAQEEGKPAVVNLSLGGHYGPHDGTSLYEQALSNLTGPGKIIVASAGNEGADPIHLNYTASGTQYSEASHTFWLTYTNATFTAADMWYETGNISVGIAAFDKDLKLIARTEAVNPGEKVENLSFTVNETTYGIITIDATTTADPNNGDKRVLIVIDGDEGKIDIGKVYWSVYTYGTGTFDAWVIKSGIFATNDIPAQKIKPGDSKKTIGIPGTARKVICTGSYVTKNEWIDLDGVQRNQLNPDPNDNQKTVVPEIGQRSYFSSIGPSRDGRTLPDISAPGEIIFSALSSDLTESVGFTRERTLQGGSYQGMEGTSMASPHVTGLVSLMLEANPNLDYDQTLQILKETARTDNYTGAVPNDYFGYGKIDALEAIKKITGSGTAVANVNSDNIAINVEPGQTASENFILSNSGNAELNYQISVDQPQPAGAKFNAENFALKSRPFGTLVMNNSSRSPKVVSSKSNNLKSTTTSVNSLTAGNDILVLDDGDDSPDTFLGFNNGQTFTWVNEFDLTGYSFSLENIKVYMQTEDAFSNYIYLSILDKNLSEISGSYISLDLSTAGKWFTISLDHPINFNDGDKIYILVSTYYSFIDFPAGFDLNANIKNKSYYMENDTLYNINSQSQFANGAFLLRAIGTKTISGTNQNPVAIATLNPTETNINEPISFDASSSYDNDGTIVNYSWTFGDGNTSNQKTITHSYSIAATYNYQLTVTDNNGATDNVSGQVKINPTSTNKKPTAIATISKTHALINEEITFDASSSYDTDGNITSYLWDFGDGTNSNQATTTHSYTQANTYNCILTVTDNDGASNDATGQIIISDTYPFLTLNYTSGSLATGEQKTIEVSLDATNLNVGKYQAHINITSNGGNIAIPVSITVDQAIFVDEKAFTIPDYNLAQNYPNPFNPTTTIKFDLPQKAFVTLKVYDIIGREVAVLLREDKSAGTHKFQFDAGKLSSGIYFYKIIANDFTATRKFILIK